VGDPVDPDEPDDDSDVPPPAKAPIADAVSETMRLLAWSRREGFAFAHVQVGPVIATGVRDLRPRFGGATPSSRNPRDAFEDIDPRVYDKDAPP